ncbi:MAG: T9SS type A sorting domain-containing protein, partial [Bacteroidetes bacterium]|nr:T9SS type A sorting domain-containing protein [Bacteroidota bacterium]
EQFGRRVSISGNGTRVAGGSREFSSNKGVVRVYTTAPNTCQDGTVTWDGGGKDEQWSTRQNWVGDKCPCDGADVVFDGTNATKDVIIRDTISMSSITANTKYRGRIRMEGDTSNLTVGSLVLQGALFVADKGKAVINVGNLEITYNSMVYTGVNGIKVSGLTYIRGGQLNPIAGTTINLNNLWVDGNGTINSPTNNGVVNLSGYLRRSSGSIFRAAGSTWNLTGNATHDLSYNTATVLTTTFNKLNIRNAATFSDDIIVVTDTLRTIGSSSNVNAGLFQAQGRVIIGSSNNTMTSLTFNAATGNQILSTATAGALVGSPIVVNKATSGNLLLGSDVNFGTLTLTKGHIDPNGFKATLTSNSISGASNASYIIGTAYVNKMNGAFSGNKITVPVGRSGSLKAIVIGNSGSKNDWKIDHVATNPSSVNSTLHSSLSSISSVEYWTAQRLTADTFSTFIGLAASGSFDRVALLDGSSWRSIGGTTSGGVITSTENNLFKSTGTYSLTQGVSSSPAPINVVADKDVVSGTEVSLEKSNVSNSVAAANNSTALSVYPNPARTSIQVVLPTQAVTFHVSDMVGRVVGSYPASVRQLDLSNLKNGMYLVTTEVNGTKQSISFVKQ